MGNHTYDHPDLTTLPDDGVREEIARAQDLIAGATGRDPRPMFRFPFGASNDRLIGVANAMGYGSAEARRRAVACIPDPPLSRYLGARRAGVSKLSGWRKIAGAMWRPPDDPQMYGILEFDASPLRAYIERARVAGHRVTATHLVGRAVAHALHEVPDFNVRIHGSKVIPRERVDVFFIAAVEGGRELSGVRVDDADRKSVLEVADELRARATAMKEGDDKEFAKTKKTIASMPRRLLRPSMRFSAWVAGDRNRSIKALGVKASPFGSAMVTSIGMFGIPQGFAPLARFYKMPLLVLVGEISDKPVAVDGRVEIRPVLPLTATIDHRYADGWHISQLIKPFKAYLQDPGAYEPAPELGVETPAVEPREAAGSAG